MNKKNQSTKFSFGSTSAIITNIALIVGLNSVANAKLAIMGSLFAIAVADNISDSFGIHMYQESEGLKRKEVWMLTFSNFFSRLITSLGFIGIIAFIPFPIAIYISVLYGLLILSAVSYVIAVNRKLNPWHSILEHLIIAVSVIFISKLLGNLFAIHFNKKF